MFQIFFFIWLIHHVRTLEVIFFFKQITKIPSESEEIVSFCFKHPRNGNEINQNVTIQINFSYFFSPILSILTTAEQTAIFHQSLKELF